MDTEKKPIPQWAKLFFAACAGAGVQTGTQKLATDSPIHFAVEGAAPAVHDGWKCEPEGGIIGAPLVCRPAAEMAQPAEPSTSTAQTPQ